MKTYFISILLLLITISCAKPPIKRIKSFPEHSTEIKNYEVKAIVDEFLDLSVRNNIKFKNKVSIGFTKINDGNVIGTCSYRLTFREIDLDYDFWENATLIGKTSLLFHELAHCYCNRDHDFGEGTMYPDNSFKYILYKWFSKSPNYPFKPEGYFDDGCPQSLMYPKLTEDYCFRVHYDEYIKDLFNRCDPY